MSARGRETAKEPSPERARTACKMLLAWPVNTRPGLIFFETANWKPRTVGSLSWLRVWPCILGAARLFCRRELHQFHPGVIRIIQIQLPLPIPPDFGLLCQFDARLLQLVCRRAHVRHPEGNVIHHAWCSLV